jgi:hypothetical protein
MNVPSSFVGSVEAMLMSGPFGLLKSAMGFALSQKQAFRPSVPWQMTPNAASGTVVPSGRGSAMQIPGGLVLW